MASCVGEESPHLLDYVIIDFQVIIVQQQLLPRIVSHIPCFCKKCIMAFPKNPFLIETQVISHTIYRKTIDLFILFIIGNFNLFSNYLLNAHCVQMYKPKFLSSNSLKSI